MTTAEKIAELSRKKYSLRSQIDGYEYQIYKWEQELRKVEFTIEEYEKSLGSANQLER